VHHRQHLSLVDHNSNSNSETDVSLLSSSSSLSDACSNEENRGLQVKRREVIIIIGIADNIISESEYEKDDGNDSNSSVIE